MWFSLIGKRNFWISHDSKTPSDPCMVHIHQHLVDFIILKLVGIYQIYGSYMGTYCWRKKSRTSWYGKYPIIYKVLYIPSGAGFCPSTVFRYILVRSTSEYLLRSPISKKSPSTDPISTGDPSHHWSHSEMARVPEGSKMRLGLARAFRKKKQDFREDLSVSENSGTPKSSILIGFSIINHPFWGSPILGNTHFYPVIFEESGVRNFFLI